MYKSVLWLVLKSALILFTFYSTACQKLADDGEEEDDSSAGGVALKVTPRAENTTQIKYPVHLYAFTEDGNCVTEKEITSGEQPMELNLSKGKYSILAISGATADYAFPKTPLLSDVINMKKGNYAKNSLMMGKANVTLGNKGANVNLQLTYMVASVDITLQNVPADVSSVKVSMASLYASMSFEGEYSDGDGELVVDCRKESMGVWVAGPLYVFPGSGTKTSFSVALESDEGTRTFGYTYKGIPQANHPFNVMGSYNGDLAVSGNLLPNKWETPIEVEFDFGSGENTGDDSGDNEDPDVSNIPSIGSIWKGCIVADVSELGNGGVDLLLMSLEEWTGTIYEVEDLIQNYTVNNIGDWRLPVEMEAKLLKSLFSGNELELLNDKIIAEGYLNIDDGSDARYLCYKDGVPYSFQFIAGSRVTKAGTAKQYFIRAVKTYHFTK